MGGRGGAIIKVKKTKQKSAKIQSKTYTNANACSPSAKSIFSKDNTCFSKDALLQIAGAWNKSSFATKTKLIPLDGSKKKLWSHIKNRITECNNEWCWLKSKSMKHLNNEIEKETFKPEIPKGKYQWLSTSDIDFVVNQFLHENSQFTFLGAVPIDFQKVYRKKFSSKTLLTLIENGIRQFGIVFNMDPSWKSGSHWTSLFIQLDKQGRKGAAEYYDSLGKDAPDQVKQFIKQFPVRLSYDYNDQKHQKENTECGVYSIHFLVNKLNNVPFDEIKKKGLTDEQVNQMRKIYFNPYF